MEFHRLYAELELEWKGKLKFEVPQNAKDQEQGEFFWFDGFGEILSLIGWS